MRLRDYVRVGDLVIAVVVPFAFCGVAIALGRDVHEQLRLAIWLAGWFVFLDVCGAMRRRALADAMERLGLERLSGETDRAVWRRIRELGRRRRRMAAAQRDRDREDRRTRTTPRA